MEILIIFIDHLVPLEKEMIGMKFFDIDFNFIFKIYNYYLIGMNEDLLGVIYMTKTIVQIETQMDVLAIEKIGLLSIIFLFKLFRHILIYYL